MCLGPKNVGFIGFWLCVVFLVYRDLRPTAVLAYFDCVFCLYSFDHGFKMLEQVNI